MVAKEMLWVFAAAGLSLTALGQNVRGIAPLPGDPLEMVTGPTQVAATAASREAALQLLARARSNYALKSAGHAYDLKITFMVNSGGQTEYDGAWEMEDLFDPQQGLRWTAKAEAGYTMTQISSHGMLFGDGTSSTIPLRLQEARAALLDPIPSTANAGHGLIRVSTSAFNGAPVSCVLLSGLGNAATATPSRRWEETEDCIDPQSGLLQVHSQVPGRYYAYDYSNAPQLSGHVLPRKVTVTEAGKIVSEISVVSLTELPATDLSLFVPTAEMKERGRATAMAGAQKIVIGGGPFRSAAEAQPVCVFGLVTPAGQLVEAHSLQPSDPHSQAAVEAAKRMNFSSRARLGAPPQQHFVFVIEESVSSQ